MSEPNDNMPKDGGPAYPAIRMEKVWWSEDYVKAEENRLNMPLDRNYTYQTSGVTYPGMSLRDYFAGQALTGFLAAPADKNGMAVGQRAREFPEIAAEWAYSQADAMLAERAK